jgi:hypothetical protein
MDHKIIFTVLSLLYLSSCSSPDYKIEQVRQSYTRYLANNGIYETCYGYGKRWGTTENTTREYYSTCQFRFDSVDTARLFFCRLHDEFVRRFNEKREIRPFLDDFPLGAKNTELHIHFVDNKKKELPYPYIAAVGNYGNRLYYRVYNHETNRLDTIHEEHFDTAHEIYVQTMAITQCKREPSQ